MNGKPPGKTPETVIFCRIQKRNGKMREIGMKNNRILSKPDAGQSETFFASRIKNVMIDGSGTGVIFMNRCAHGISL